MRSWGWRVGTFLGSRVFKKTTACCIMLVLYLVAGHAVENYFDFRLRIPEVGSAVFGAALSILMVLRTNSAYDRWWEGRKLWGSLVNTCRNLSLKVQIMSQADAVEKARAGRYVTLYPYTLRDHLRSGVLEETLKSFPEPLPQGVTHVPAYLSGRLFEIVKGWRDREQLNKLDHHLMDRHICDLLDICGACERIRNTPLPLAHRALIPQLLTLYLMVVPLSLELNLPNACGVFFLGYFLIGLELVAEEIEEPFGKDIDDLQTDLLSKGIERVVRQNIPALRELEPISDLS